MFHDFDPLKPAYDPDKCEFSDHIGDVRVAGEDMEDEFSDPIEGKADDFGEPVETDKFNLDD